MNAHKIVVVDDEPAIRRLLRAALERAGYAVVEVGNAKEALSAVSIDRPDAVLLDLGLPDREGLELVPLIVKSGSAVVVISAREATQEKIAALDLGADDFGNEAFRHRRSARSCAPCLTSASLKQWTVDGPDRRA